MSAILSLSLSSTSLAASLYTIWSLRTVKGSRLYIKRYQIMNTFSCALQLVQIVGISLLFYGQTDDSVYAGWKVVVYVGGILTQAEILLAVLCEALLIHLIGAFHSFFNENRGRSWMTFFISLYLILTSLYNVNSVSIVIAGYGIISTVFPYYDMVNGILLTIWCMLAIIYPLIQNMYLGWSFYNLRKQTHQSNKTAITHILLLLVLGLALNLVAVYLYSVLPNTVAKNQSSLNLAANSLRAILVAVIGRSQQTSAGIIPNLSFLGFRLCLSPIIFLKMREILFDPVQTKASRNFFNIRDPVQMAPPANCDPEFNIVTVETDVREKTTMNLPLI